MRDQSHIDLLNLIGSDAPLKKVASTYGGEYAGPCPFCGGDDRFRVWPEDSPLGGRWWCRQCSRHGDAITYLVLRDCITYRAACNQLDIPQEANCSAPSHRVSVHRSLPTKQKQSPAMVDPSWQEHARQFVARSEELLWSPAGREAIKYLRDGRGLTDAVIRQYRLGYNPQDSYEHWSDRLEKDVWLPRGIVIPWELDGTIWCVNFRRNDEEKRYIQAAGGTKTLYIQDSIRANDTVLLTEGEFDALSLLSSVPDLYEAFCIRPIAIGGIQGGRDIRWMAKIASARRVILALDDDEAGEQACAWWQERLGDRAVRLRPKQHDIGDMVALGEDMFAWLRSAVA